MNKLKLQISNNTAPELRTIAVDSKAYKVLRHLKEETGISMMDLATEMILFASDYVELESEGEENVER